MKWAGLNSKADGARLIDISEILVETIIVAGGVSGGRTISHEIMRNWSVPRSLSLQI